MKAAVRQIKGPGMNLGIKKPRMNYIPKPKPYKQPLAIKQAMAADTSSYLGASPTGKSLKLPKPPKAPKAPKPPKSNSYL
jgi:hypothetical protein